jgi:hypothetical protein
MLRGRARRIAKEKAWLDRHTQTLGTARQKLEAIVTRLTR